jgi:N6-adenosine-specific RNA methylase IME4
MDDQKQYDPQQIAVFESQLPALDDPVELRDIENKAEAVERYMKSTGLYDAEQIRAVNELRLKARWHLGRVLKTVERGAPGPAGDKGGTRPQFRAFIKSIKLAETAAKEAQRINALPFDQLLGVLARHRDTGTLCSFADLVREARPFWYKESRKAKHEQIRHKAEFSSKLDVEQFGPFPLIYADPPWRFDTFSEKGLERSPDQHYETLSDRDIIDFQIGGRPLSRVIAEDAALFLWCTSSNIERALAILAGWGFEFKSSAVWIKDKIGTGHVFRNRHELLLYGTRGSMPGPQWQPDSVFEYPRGAHSAKPAQVREVIELMYPDFDQATRLELFARGDVPGWSTYGLEA